MSFNSIAGVRAYCSYLLSLALRLTSIAVLLGPALLSAQGTGYWHTNGSKILDSKNATVRIAGINWYGFETTDAVVHGLYSQDYHTILNTIEAEGFNTIRLPFSNQMVEAPTVPSAIGFSGVSGPINTDLKGLNSLQIMDKVIAAAGKLGLRVILDNHRSEAGNSNEPSGLWYTSTYTEAKWIYDWRVLADRYKTYADSEGNPTVIGMDLRNEPHLIGAGGGFSGSCWTGDTLVNGCPTTNTVQNWPAAAGRAASAILKINPSLLIFVEGTECYNGDCGWQGANLEGAGKYPVVTTVQNQIAYSAHDYGPDLYPQSWFSNATTGTTLAVTWNKFWGYLNTQNIAPVWIGEFGTTNTSADVESNTPGSQGQWFQSLVSYLGNNPSIQWTYWAVNGEDSFALLDNSYDPIPASALKEQLLHSIQFPLVDEPVTKPCVSAPAAPTGLAATVGSSSSIALKWTAVTAPANCSVSYNAYRSTSTTFTPSTANQVASGIASPSYADSGLAAGTKYTYIVEAIDAYGSSKASALVSATTTKACASVPAAPTGLTATSASSSGIALKWGAVTPPANCAASYSVYRSTSTSFTPSAAKLIKSGVTATTYADSGLLAGTKYQYIVEAADAFGSSPASAVASATTTGTPSNKATTACHVTYSVTGDWGTGFQTSIEIDNTGTAAISNWTLAWSFAQQQVISSAWNASEAQSGKSVTLTSMSYNATIAPSSSVTGIGFTASYSGTNTAPTQFTLNGVVCK